MQKAQSHLWGFLILLNNHFVFDLERFRKDRTNNPAKDIIDSMLLMIVTTSSKVEDKDNERKVSIIPTILVRHDKMVGTNVKTILLRKSFIYFNQSPKTARSFILFANYTIIKRLRQVFRFSCISVGDLSIHEGRELIDKIVKTKRKKVLFFLPKLIITMSVNILLYSLCVSIHRGGTCVELLDVSPFFHS